MRIPLSRHNLTPVVMTVDVANAGTDAASVSLSAGGSCPIRHLTTGEARVLANALIDAAERIEP